ncbi:MAG: DUF5110 domain-containing protein [Anaerolineales bacterium]|nr:DUF5110 domain-containing protein [Anaerolineales bacterium]
MPYQFPSIPFQPLADPAAIVRAPGARFTVLTDRLIRLEYDPEERFEERPSQVFWFRQQPVPPFRVNRSDSRVEIDTGALLLSYQVSPRGFRRETLSITVRATGVTWRYGDWDHRNLRGTGRTLDGADGAIELEHGLLSRSGWAVVDDSHSLVFDETGWLTLRPAGKRRDVYFFGYGRDYAACLQDYFKVAGRVPLIPRWVLGNWWSRYWEYSQEELQNLMLEFRRRETPLSVCIIDMDWHITHTGNESSGWTGYTWNRQLFPDPPGLLRWLHEMGLRTAMNLHPADGIWPHEEMYPEMAKRMGIDPASGQPVRFDIADPEFTRHYFEVLHHPYEEQGVDFWWMDWQQGARLSESRREVAEQLDPLWWLNHLHFYDLGRDGSRRPFVFSRWGGLGNHRYPIGFSGDSVVSWKSLAFQPYFTATAANVGFGWWSHDIGGHMDGIEDPELYLRWVQYGVFSPILRLHCTKNPYQDRAPWSFGEDTFRLARAALRLRHALIPYIYTMAWRFSQTAIPLCAPMYYEHPEEENAYRCPNQYLFGDQLLAAPFVSPRDVETGLSQTTVWLPKGEWYHFFSGERFTGGRWVTLYGGLEDIPVFARAGSIVPLAGEPSLTQTEPPEQLVLELFPGGDGAFTLYEDDGVSRAFERGAFSRIRITQRWEETRQIVRIEPAEGETGHLPAARSLELRFRGIRQPEKLRVTINGDTLAAETTWNEPGSVFSVRGITLAPSDSLEVELAVRQGTLREERDRRPETVRRYLRAFRMSSWFKKEIDAALPDLLTDPNALGAFAVHLTPAQRAALERALKGELASN